MVRTVISCKFLVSIPRDLSLAPENSLISFLTMTTTDPMEPMGSMMPRNGGLMGPNPTKLTWFWVTSATARPPRQSMRLYLGGPAPIGG